jgi:hypothetical protein
MMQAKYLISVVAAATCIVIGMPSLAPAQAWKIFRPISAPVKFTADVIHREKPHSPKDGVVEQLANEIDWLEHHIDSYGTIVAKHPDVWGESRLMRHRQEYEKQMAQQLDKFEVRLNGALSRSDQAFLGMAFSLSNAAAGGEATAASSQQTQVAAMISNPNQASGDAANPEVVVRSGPFGLAGAAPQSAFSFEPGPALSLEPTIELDQMSRYLAHLHELRRINEGDDNADSPGYSLNLVRIPISVLPGRHTREGYGAEITVTAQPYVTPELLPMTFRTLVVNDLVDQLSYPITRVINSQQPKLLAELDLLAESHLATSISRRQLAASEGLATVIDGVEELPRASASRAEVNLDDQASAFTEAANADTVIGALNAIRGDAKYGFFNEVRRMVADPSDTTSRSATDGERGDAYEETARKLRRLSSELRGVISAASIPASNNRRAQRPLPPTHVVKSFDLMLLAHIAADTYSGLLDHPVNRDADRRPVLHLMDVRTFLQEEAAAAYDFLSSPTNLHVWELCVPGLADAVRSQDYATLDRLKNTFLKNVNVTDAYIDGNTTIALAWALLVESALLDQRLNQDVREATIAKGCACGTAEYVPFYGPNPPPEARQTFIEYVNCRWPIQVFALDPVIQEQNIADAYARRRELQVAASIAFASGNMSSGALLRFNRRLEWDMATIDLNRTAIGFTHGNDTFGWRFQPRFQTPPVQGNIAAFGQSLFGGPTDDQDLKRRQLESGIRECIAIVVMPSFVPYCTFDTRANWFKLTDPKCTAISMHDNLRLSRAVTSMRHSRIECAHLAQFYRPGEIDRLLKRVDQLDRELPLQTMQVQIPFEATAGGFELFNHGITDLAPELVGFYGEPGINRNSVTTLFLVGDAFSVHETRVIAGGRQVESRLLSRQVMEVQIPPGVQVLNDREYDEVVDIHVATPYGISSHLLVPVAKPENVGQGPGIEFELLGPPAIRMTYTKSTTTAAPIVTSATVLAAADVNPRSINIQAPLNGTSPATAKISFYLSIGGSPVGFADVDAVPLDQRTQQYLITGTPLTNLLTALRTAADNLIDRHLATNANDNIPFTFDLHAEALLNGNLVVPIRQAGTVTVSPN